MKKYFLWPEAIIPNVYQDEVYLYNDLFSKKFHKNHLIGLGAIKRELKG